MQSGDQAGMTDRTVIQNILHPDDEYCSVKELFYREDPENIHVNGYFNLFCIEKRKAYTTIDELYLELEVKGFASLILMHDRTRILEMDLPTDGSYTVRFPYEEFDSGVFWFMLKKRAGSSGTGQLFTGCYTGRAAKMRTVNIAVDICTFRREEMLLKNLRTITDRVLARNGHIRVYVADNAGSLSGNSAFEDVIGRSCGRIRIIPNRNVGGAGGFTRGMIEALRQKEEFGFTHILLMDDDAVFEPDLFTRLFSLLSTLKDEYADATVGGALLRSEFPYVQQVSGEYLDKFAPRSDFSAQDLREFDICTSEYMCGTGREYDLYAAWWCCCYPVGTVREDSLPVPFFLHCDDIEFGLRNSKHPVLFLNGICIWHPGGDLMFRRINNYYDVRNYLVTNALHLPDTTWKDAVYFILRLAAGAVFEYRYHDVRLIADGVKDFLKGPGLILDEDEEEKNASIRQYYNDAMPAYRVDESPDRERFAAIDKSVDLQLMRSLHDGSLKKGRTGWKQLLTLNGHLLPAIRTDKEMIICTWDAPAAAYRQKSLILYEPFTNRYYMVRRDPSRCIGSLAITALLAVRLAAGYSRTAERFKGSFKELTSLDMWERRL